MADGEEAESFGAENLSELFTQATEYVKTLQKLSDEQKLLFYGLFKQAKEGPCKTSRPGFWDMVGKSKWDSWHQHGTMSREMAANNYVKELFSMDPEWDIKLATSENSEVTREYQSEGPKQSMGITVSTLQWDEEEVISDRNKTVFDWCKEGNIKRMDSSLSTGDVNIDITDDQGMCLLHWACDRGHEHVVDYLIKHNANVNLMDGEGQTPLHYAATCEFLPIVKRLLAAKALTNIADVDGCLATDATDNKGIRALLQKS